MRSAAERLRKATEAWFITEPLLFAVWIGHRLVERPGARSLRSGAGRVEYSAAFVQGLPDRALGEVLRLEAIRVLLKHPYSRRPDDPERAWLASNITLKEHVPTPLPLPSAREVFGGAEHDRQYFERYCDLLASPSARAGAGAPSEPPSADSEPPSAGGGPGEPPSALQQHFQPESGGENAQLWEEDSFQQEAINEAIRSAQASQSWGSVAGELRSLVLASLRPRLSYRRVLRHFRASILASGRELTRMKQSRRYGALYQGSRHPLRTRLLVAVDVSGSISADDIAQAYGVVARLFRYGVEAIDVLQFDAAIQGPVQSLKRAQREVRVRGGGGTSFAPVLAYIDEHRGYDGLLIITDGIAPVPAPPKNRRTRVLWLFSSQAHYQSLHQALRPIGAAAYVHSSASSSSSASAPASKRP